MNSNSKTEKTEITIGNRLLQARVNLNLSREIVAEQLCLKIYTIRVIEEDNNSHNIEPTFLRGYIRSYAKLVKIPEKEILELLEKYTPTKTVVISPMQSYSMGKTHKKLEGWLVVFTWIMIIICISMIGIWWRQGYKVQKQEIINMSEQNNLNIDQLPEELVPTSNIGVRTEENNINKSIATSVITNDIISQIPKKHSLISESIKNNHKDLNIKLKNLKEGKTLSLSENGINNFNNTKQISTEKISVDSNTSIMKSSNEVVISFNGKCWLEIRNIKNKILFSGIKNIGQKLELNNEFYYKFNIGVPANVNMLFNGKYIDLNRFIKASRTANFKLPEL
ncbi:MAG: cytoskeleton protein RodZ [Arsenophonus sp.]